LADDPVRVSAFLMPATEATVIAGAVFLGGGSVAVGHAPAVTRVERRKLLVTLHAIAATVVVSGEHGGPDGRNRPRGSRLLRHLI